jgi:Bacteriophage Mu, GemA protein
MPAVPHRDSRIEAGRRRGELAAIHTGKRMLGLDDELYRDLLERVTGHRSAAALDGDQRHAVIEELRRLGFAKTPSKRAGRTRLADGKQARLARALWLELFHLQAIHDSSERALGAFAERITGIRELSWLRGEDFSRLIGALVQWRDRVAAERSAKAKTPEETT